MVEKRLMLFLCAVRGDKKGSDNGSPTTCGARAASGGCG